MAVRLLVNFKLCTLARVESFGGFAHQLGALASRMLSESAALAGVDVSVLLLTVEYAQLFYVFWLWCQ